MLSESVKRRNKRGKHNSYTTAHAVQNWKSIINGSASYMARCLSPWSMPRDVLVGLILELKWFTNSPLFKYVVNFTLPLKHLEILGFKKVWLFLDTMYLKNLILYQCTSCTRSNVIITQQCVNRFIGNACWHS